MTNKEKYEKEILDIFCETFMHPALTKEGLVKCDTAECADCLFRAIDCEDYFQQWLESEYKEPEIDWTKVPVDTKIYVRDSEDMGWLRRYFHSYSKGKINAFEGGSTSWSATPNNYSTWDLADIADPEERKKYLKNVW